MLPIAGSIMVVALTVAALEGIWTGSTTPITKAVTALPAAVLKTALLVPLTALLVGGTDQIANWLDGSILHGLGLAPAAVGVAIAAAIADTDVVGLIVALILICAVLAIWAELAVRAALVYLVVMTAPMVIMASVHPRLRQSWTRLAEIGAAVIFAKVLIALSLAVGFSEITSVTSSSSFSQALAALLVALTTLGISCFAPFVLFRLISVEVAQLEGLARRPARAVRDAQQLAYYNRHGLSSYLNRMSGERPGAAGPPGSAGFPGGPKEPGGAAGPVGSRPNDGGGASGAEKVGGVAGGAFGDAAARFGDASQPGANNGTSRMRTTGSATSRPAGSDARGARATTAKRPSNEADRRPGRASMPPIGSQPTRSVVPGARRRPPVQDSGGSTGRHATHEPAPATTEDVGGAARPSPRNGAGGVPRQRATRPATESARNDPRPAEGSGTPPPRAEGTSRGDLPRTATRPHPQSVEPPHPAEPAPRGASKQGATGAPGIDRGRLVREPVTVGGPSTQAKGPLPPVRGGHGPATASDSDQRRAPGFVVNGSAEVRHALGETESAERAEERAVERPVTASGSPTDGDQGGTDA